MNVPRLHRETVLYWLFAMWALAVSAFGIGIAGWMLSMSVAGRLRSGAVLNVIATTLVLLWVAMLGAFDVALWRIRHLPADLQLMRLARAAQPDNPVAAVVWWWTRLAWYAWLSFMALLLTTAAAAWLLDRWK